MVAAIEDYSGWPRARIVAFISLLLRIAGLGTALSFNLLADFHPLAFIPAFAERNIFESLDYIVSNFMMPAGGVLIAVLAGWGLSRKATTDEPRLSQGALYASWRLLVRFVVPTAIALVFMANF